MLLLHCVFTSAHFCGSVGILISVCTKALMEYILSEKTYEVFIYILVMSIFIDHFLTYYNRSELHVHAPSSVLHNISLLKRFQC